jgi:hypothetical protein
MVSGSMPYPWSPASDSPDSFKSTLENDGLFMVWLRS